MVRRSPKKQVEKALWKSRLEKGLLFQKQAQDNYDLLDAGQDAAGVLSDVILSAIAIGDAVTIKAFGIVNTNDHSGLPVLIRHALGNRANTAQMNALASLLSLKNEAQYGFKKITKKRAEDALETLRKFSIWAQQILATI